MTQDGVEDTPARAARALTTCFFLPPPSFFRNNNHQILEFFKKKSTILTGVAKEKINNFFSIFSILFLLLKKSNYYLMMALWIRIKRYAFRELLRCVSDSQIFTFRFKLNVVVHLTSDTKLMVRNFPKKEKKDKVYKTGPNLFLHLWSFLISLPGYKLYIICFVYATRGLAYTRWDSFYFPL